MSQDAVNSTIDLVIGQVDDLANQLLAKKRMVNDLCGLAGRPPMYADADLVSRASGGATRPDEYYGQPQASVVRAILLKRGQAKLGAATVGEIYDEMVAGGFHFGGKNADNNKRGLYISLGKNSTTFHKLPNGSYGLVEWYSDLKGPKRGTTNGNGKSGDKALHEELQDETADDELAALVASKHVVNVAEIALRAAKPK